MTREAPFDVWDGEGLDRPEADEMHAAEEVAMRVDTSIQPAWSEMTDGAERDDAEPTPVHYFRDEEPERPRVAVAVAPDGEPEPDLEEILEHQHYAFPEEHRG